MILLVLIFEVVLTVKGVKKLNKLSREDVAINPIPSVEETEAYVASNDQEVSM